jgi:hypothetical protein
VSAWVGDSYDLLKCPKCGASNSDRDLRHVRSECHYCKHPWYHTSNWVLIGRMIRIAKIAP